MFCYFKMCLRFTLLYLITLALIITLNVSGCQKQKQFGPPEKITIAYSTAPNALLMAIALAKGYFSEEGLDATSQPHPFGKPALQAVIEGKADIATAGDTPIVFAVMEGRKITTLAAIQISNRDNAIVANRERGIARPSDLKGKTIGLTLGTTGHFFADSFLLMQGIDEKQVKIINLKPDEMAEALDTGKVDAVSTWNPALMQAKKKLGSKGIIFFDESIATEIFCVAAGQEYVKKIPKR